MTITFPSESADYRAARDQLLEQQIEQRRATEAVAASRRALSPGGPVSEDYVFQGADSDGAPTNVKLSELFEPGKNSLVIYNFMFPRDPGDTSPGPAIGETALLSLEEGPCPSCVALLDQLDGAAEHARQHINFAVVAKTSLARLLTFAEERGWRRLRLLSSAANTYNRDYHGETAEGFQRPMLGARRAHDVSAEPRRPVGTPAGSNGSSGSQELRRRDIALRSRRLSVAVEIGREVCRGDLRRR